MTVIPSIPRFGGCLHASTQKIARCVLYPEACDYHKSVSYVRPDEIVGNVCNNIWEEPTKDDDFDDDGPSSLKKYPYCKNRFTSEVRCAIVQADCSENEDFLSLDQVRGIAANGGDAPADCFCYDVPTGLCSSKVTEAVMASENSFCVVGPHDCMEPYAFRPASELLQMEDLFQRSCRLCRKEDIGSSGPDEYRPVPQRPTQKEVNYGKNGGIVAAALGLLVLSTILFDMFVKKKKQDGINAKGDSNNAIQNNDAEMNVKGNNNAVQNNETEVTSDDGVELTDRSGGKEEKADDYHLEDINIEPIT